MNGFPIVQRTITQKPRVGQQDIAATAVKPSSLAQTTLVNTQAETLGPAVLINGARLSITSLFSNSVNPDYKLGVLPYNLIFFQDNLNTSSIIGFNVTGYNINGPMSFPQFEPLASVDVDGNITVGGNNGANILMVTELINNTGNTHTIYAITDSRAYVPTGGSA